MNNSVKGRILDLIRGFPTLQGNVTRILESLRDPDSEVGDLEKAIRYDPGLTANILRQANSARFGCAGGIGSIREAIVRLGRKRLADLVLAASVGDMLAKPVSGYEIPPGALWQHSVAVASAAELLSKRVRGNRQEDVFAPALLHDIGKMILGEFVGENHLDFEQAIDGLLAFDVVERNMVGLDHAKIGAMLLRRWRFPEHIVRAVRWHHRPDDCPVLDPVLDIVHMADAIAMMLGFSEGFEGLTYSVSPRVAERLGLGSDDIEELAMETLQVTEEIDLAA